MFVKKSRLLTALFMLLMFLKPVMGKDITTIYVKAEDQKELLLSDVVKEVEVVNILSNEIDDIIVTRTYTWGKDLLIIESQQKNQLFLYDKSNSKIISFCDDISTKNSSAIRNGCSFKHFVGIDGRNLCITANDIYYLYKRKGGLVDEFVLSKYDEEALIFFPYYPMGSKGVAGLEIFISGQTKETPGVNGLQRDLFNQTLLTIDKRGDVLKYDLPSSYFYDASLNFQDISSIGNKIYMHFSTNDTIYTINKNNGKVSASYVFDFGSNAMPSLQDKLYSEVYNYLSANREYIGYPTKVLTSGNTVSFEYNNCGQNEVGFYNLKSGTVINGKLVNDLFTGRNLKLVGSDKQHLIFVAERPAKKEYSESVLRFIAQNTSKEVLDDMQKDDREKFSVSEKAADYMSRSDYATLCNAQEDDVVLLFVKMK